MAGVSTKEIKNRIRSMESTKQITKAMEMVAASKLRRAQAQIAASRPYFEILHRTIEDITRVNRDFSSPYLKKREGKKILYLVIAGDRGLAGGYNSNVLKLVYSQIQGQEATVLPIGKKAVDSFQNKGVPMLSQTPDFMKLLPLEKPETKEAEPPRRCDTLYEHPAEEVFAAIVPEYLGGMLYGALCESRASEQAARRSAMDSATQNADDMIADLSLKFNRARQAAITQEITEIVAGS